jgi:hypothetical protein
VGHVLHSDASGAQITDALLFMLGWDRYGFDKKCSRTCYAELVFLHPVGAAGQEMYSGVSEAGKVDTLFFMLWWDRYRFHKNHAGTHYAKLVFLHPVGYAGHIVHSDASGSRNVNTLFTCSGGTSTDRTKAQWNMLRRICVFASNMIYGSRSALRCIPGVKHQRNIFHARVGAVQISQNALQDMLC